MSHWAFAFTLHRILLHEFRNSKLYQLEWYDGKIYRTCVTMILTPHVRPNYPWESLENSKWFDTKLCRACLSFCISELRSSLRCHHTKHTITPLPKNGRNGPILPSCDTKPPQTNGVLVIYWKLEKLYWKLNTIRFGHWNWRNIKQKQPNEWFCHAQLQW